MSTPDRRPPTFARRVELYSPETEVEVLLLKSVLDSAGIDYFVKNDTFGALTPGPQIAMCNRRIFLVPEDQLDEAREVVREFLRRTEIPQPRRYPLREKIRMVFEVLLFGWFLPGRRHRLPQLHLIHGTAPGNDEPVLRSTEGVGSEPHRGPPRLVLVHPPRPEAPEPALASGAEDRATDP